jgi:hypothetical protein
MKRSAIILLALGAAVARADVATWFWTVSDTGNGDGVIEPGESARITLWAGFDPRHDYSGGFSEAGPYTISGDAAWSAGIVEEYRNLLDPEHAFGDGTLDGATNAIAGVHHFQWSPGIGDQFNPSNPIMLYAIRWKPANYDPTTVLVGNGGPDAWIYTSSVGDRSLYAGAGGAGTFVVVPAPCTGLMLPVAAVLCPARRRR